MKLKKLLNMSVNEIELSVRAGELFEQRQHHHRWSARAKTEGEMLKFAISAEIAQR